MASATLAFTTTGSPDLVHRRQDGAIRGLVHANSVQGLDYRLDNLVQRARVPIRCVPHVRVYAEGAAAKITSFSERACVTQPCSRVALHLLNATAQQRDAARKELAKDQVHARAPFISKPSGHITAVSGCAAVVMQPS